MNARLLPLLFALLFCRLPAQPSLTDLDWSLRYGDDPAWAEVEPAGPLWHPINLGISWERQNLPNYATAWLRHDFAWPETWAAQPLALDLRMGAERVDIYLNGQPLARLDSPKVLARVEVPAGALRRGSANRLALRVAGHAWTGGSNDDIVRLVPRDAAAPTLDVEVVYGPADHGFRVQDDTTFETRVHTAGVAGAVVASVRVVSDFHAEVYVSEQTFAAADGSRTLHWTPGRLPPGFYQAQVRVSAAGYHAQHVSWLAVDPTRIPSSARPPADLDAYWARAKRELAAVPPAFRVVKDEPRSDARHTVYTVEMASVEGVTLRAWYIVPAKPGRYPAVLDVPGYSVAQQPEWFLDDDDLIHLVLDIRGHGRSAEVLNPGFGLPGFVGYRVNEPEHYVYKGAYLDCGRALEFLATRPEVDAKRIGVMGGSQGGGLAFATAALFPERVAACGAGMPYLGAFRDHLLIRDVYRGEMQVHVDRYPGATWLDVDRSMALVDTVHLAPRIRCPVIMGTGLFDDDCPSHIGFAVYNAVTSPKRYLVYPDEAHLLGARWRAASRAFVRESLGLPER